MDLAANVPGQAVRALADAELAAMRERSRLGAVIARALDVKTDEHVWRVGAGGEETVGARLDKSASRAGTYCTPYPSAPEAPTSTTSSSDPAACGRVNTKRHPGKSIWVGRTSVLVDGHRQR